MMSVTVTELDTEKKSVSRTFFKNFTVASRLLDAVLDTWHYELTDPVTNALWEAGERFSESQLSMRS